MNVKEHKEWMGEMGEMEKTRAATRAEILKRTRLERGLMAVVTHQDMLKAVIELDRLRIATDAIVLDILVEIEMEEIEKHKAESDSDAATLWDKFKDN